MPEQVKQSDQTKRLKRVNNPNIIPFDDIWNEIVALSERLDVADSHHADIAEMKAQNEQIGTVLHTLADLALDELPFGDGRRDALDAFIRRAAASPPPVVNPGEQGGDIAGPCPNCKRPVLKGQCIINGHCALCMVVTDEHGFPKLPSPTAQERKLVVCPACSRTGGADRNIEHEPPICAAQPPPDAGSAEDDDGWFGPFAVAEVTKEFNNPRHRIGVFSKNGKLTMHFECQEDADRHAKWWNKIHAFAASRVREAEGRAKRYRYEIVFQTGCNPKELDSDEFWVGRPVVNARMGEAHRERFAVIDRAEKAEAREKWLSGERQVLNEQLTAKDAEIAGLQEKLDKQRQYLTRRYEQAIEVQKSIGKLLTPLTEAMPR